LEAKVRYRSQRVPATLFAEDGRLRVRFQEPQRALTPGQAIVFYEGERVLGGGIIAARSAATTEPVRPAEPALR
jgi:tRNA-specific 2-thiouridylase